MNVIIFHGSTPHASADCYWYRGLAETRKGWEMDAAVAELPLLDREPLEYSLRKFRDLGLPVDGGTVLIGHSAGTNLIFSLLEQVSKPVRATYLVAGYCSPHPNPSLTLKDSYDWPRIKANAGEVYLFNSFNDPFNCNELQGKLLFDHLGGTLLLRNHGHFLQTRQPLLLKLLLPLIPVNLKCPDDLPSRSTTPYETTDY
ncbi:hypothetical protein [Bifidobacterium xylocopae]|uniref:hypothetical protein n=1 Tax=Bifidobacterium xylocopae TaxID=2493119 RepID=UPI00191BBF9B|nr:hypothetical protein [Bifidobacterium xylocopae]